MKHLDTIAGLSMIGHDTVLRLPKLALSSSDGILGPLSYEVCNERANQYQQVMKMIARLPILQKNLLEPRH